MITFFTASQAARAVDQSLPKVLATVHQLQLGARLGVSKNAPFILTPRDIVRIAEEFSPAKVAERKAAAKQKKP